VSDPYLIFSKSRSEAEWECRRLEYLKYLFGGLGLRPLAPQFELEYGSIMHDAAAMLARQDDPGIVFSHCRGSMQQLGPKLNFTQAQTLEWSTIIEGSVRAFHRKILPAILREFQIIDIEVPCLLPVDPSIDAYFVAKPDLILRHRITGKLWYWEHKSTGSVDPKWVNSWTRAVQVHTGIKAAERKYGEPFDGCFVLGWYKGYKNSWDNTQNSVFAYGWMSPGAPGITDDRYEYKKPQKWKGWEKFPTSNFVDGLAPWIAAMPDQLIMEQFVRTPPIMMREDLVKDYLAQLKVHARQIRSFQESAADVEDDAEARELLNIYFPQSFNKCDPSWGRYHCPMQECCWSSATASDPLASGLYKKNEATSEHRLEFVKLIQKETV
jgi:hypothetical protein